jgi:hypothetical protein
MTILFIAVWFECLNASNAARSTDYAGPVGPINPPAAIYPGFLAHLAAVTENSEACELQNNMTKMRINVDLHAQIRIATGPSSLQDPRSDISTESTG